MARPGWRIRQHPGEVRFEEEADFGAGEVVFYYAHRSNHLRQSREALSGE